MGVYIKGMEMPKHDDEYVIFTVYGDGGVVYGPLNRPHVRYKNRAVPVPDHVRLISAELLKADFTGNFTDAYPTALVHAMIDDAPTVIPAEEK